MRPRDRLVRLAGGIGLILLGMAIFHISKQHDPANRAAILSIFAILVGGSLTSQGLRGRHDSPVYRADSGPKGTALPLNRTILGLVAGWLVPGLGHWTIGRRGKALLYFTTITATFVTGVILAQGRNMSYDREWIYFLAYMFNGLETLLAYKIFGSLELDKSIRFLQLGFLYTAVACLLNVVAMMDYVATCLRGKSEDAGNDDEPEAPEGTE